jgi:hypothetical protein
MWNNHTAWGEQSRLLSRHDSDLPTITRIGYAVWGLPRAMGQTGANQGRLATTRQDYN